MLRGLHRKRFLWTSVLPLFYSTSLPACALLRPLEDKFNERRGAYAQHNGTLRVSRDEPSTMKYVLTLTLRKDRPFL